MNRKPWYQSHKSGLMVAQGEGVLTIFTEI